MWGGKTKAHKSAACKSDLGIVITNPMLGEASEGSACYYFSSAKTIVIGRGGGGLWTTRSVM